MKKNMNLLEIVSKEVLNQTLECLSTAGLVSLYNTFIEESLFYGADSTIYDIKNPLDMQIIKEIATLEECAEIFSAVQEGCRYFIITQEKLFCVKDENTIKDKIKAFWDEIFERIMLFPSCYTELTGDDNVPLFYLDSYVFPTLNQILVSCMPLSHK